MEKVTLVIDNERFIPTLNPFWEKSTDYISTSLFTFKRGTIYGLICEHGGGGEAISRLISGLEPLVHEHIYVDDLSIGNGDEPVGWYMGAPIYKGSWLKREICIKEALMDSLKQNNRYRNINMVAEEFHLSLGRMKYKLSNNCEWERWRASLAIGYVLNKKVFCFPWMDTLEFFDCMYNSSVFLFFKKLKDENAIVLLPTSRTENVKGLADEVINISYPRYKKTISESSYFKKWY